MRYTLIFMCVFTDKIHNEINTGIYVTDNSDNDN